MKIARVAAMAAILAGALLVSGCKTPYARFAPGRFGGYSDVSTGGNSWRVKATTNNGDPRGKAMWMALYRSAELTKAAGFGYFQIVDANGRIHTFSINYGAPHYEGEDVDVLVRAVDGPDGIDGCARRSDNPCSVLSVQR